MTYTEDKDEPKDLNDLFPIMDNISYFNIDMNKTFDIKKIDVKRLADRFGAFNATEDTAIDARRQVVLPYHSGVWWFHKATLHMMKQKTTDIMLQHIYMARHIMRELEADPNFSTEDTGYKIGLLYKKLLTLSEKMENIYEMMQKKGHLYKVARQHVLLHQVSIKLHVEFVYVWSLIVKVDAKYREANKEKPKLAKMIAGTGGITDDEGAPRIG